MRNRILRVVIGTAMAVVVGAGLVAAPADAAAPSVATKCTTTVKVSGRTATITIKSNKKIYFGQTSFIVYWVDANRRIRSATYDEPQYGATERATRPVGSREWYKIRTWHAGTECRPWYASTVAGKVVLAHRGTAKPMSLALAGAATAVSCRVERPSVRRDRTLDLLMSGAPSGRQYAFVVKARKLSDLGTQVGYWERTFKPVGKAYHTPVAAPKGYTIYEARGGCWGSPARMWKGSVYVR